MATSTATYITDQSQPYRPFYYLKVTGLPYYFFATIDPTSSTAYGGSAWTLPSGYTAKRGMMIPDDTIEQGLDNILGGISSAERLRLEMLDFDVSDAFGVHSFFGRLLSPGRLAESTDSPIGGLYSDIAASATTGGTFDVQHAAFNAFTGGDVFVGGETIGVSAREAMPGSVNGTRFTIAVRNKFPCSSVYPPTPYHRVVHDSSGNVLAEACIPVAEEPLTFVGRTAAFYIGHLRPDGMPEPESQACLRLIGRIKSIDYGRQPGLFEFTIESIMADIAKAKVAPGLAHGEIADGIYIPGEHWRKFTIAAESSFDSAQTFWERTVTVDNGSTNIYPNIDYFVRQINSALAASPLTVSFPDDTTADIVFSCDTVTVNGDTFARLKVLTANELHSWKFSVSSSPASTSTGTFHGSATYGLLSVLGWDPTVNKVDLLAGQGFLLIEFSASAPRPAPRVALPTAIMGGTVTLPLTHTIDATGNRFFSDQGDGTSVAYARIGNGAIVLVTAHSSGTLTIQETIFGRKAQLYYVTPGDVATIDQVLMFYPTFAKTSRLRQLGRLLASTTAFANDGDFNIFPEGVGMGLLGALDTSALARYEGSFPKNSTFTVDASTVFGDLWTPTAIEAGACLVWNPAASQITVRMIQTGGRTALSVPAFTESNRASVDDFSKVSAGDLSNARTGWTVKYGYDPIEKKYTREIDIKDNYAISAYQVDSRAEVISDPMVPAGDTDQIDDIVASLVERATLVHYPWAKLTRSMNKTGLLLSPGTYHQIVDANVFNPFTGERGITATDEVYCWLQKVSMRLDSGSVTITVLVNQFNKQVRPFSPTALVDFAAANNGYNSSTGVLTLKAHYSSDSTGSTGDGADFEVGDEVKLRSWDYELNPTPYLQTTTVSAVSTDGFTVTIGTGLTALLTTAETIMMLRDYINVPTARQTGSSRVSFQADGNSLKLAGVARPHRWG